MKRLEGHTRYVTSCVFSSDNRMLATGSNDRTVIVWPIDPLSFNTEFSPQASIEKSSFLERRNSIDLLQNKSSVCNWSVEDVLIWLADLGLKDEYGHLFVENEINGQELLYLSHDTLLTCLKISALGHRNRILRGVQNLRNPLWQHISLSNDDNVSIPQELMCPITQDFMNDPVVAADGYSYERQAIVKWIENGKTTSPMTNEPLTNLTLIPNRTLGLLIKKYMTP